MQLTIGYILPMELFYLLLKIVLPMVKVIYDYRFDIYHEYFVGSFTIDDLISHYISFGINNKLPRKFNVIVDYTSAEFVFEIDELVKLGEAVKKIIKNYKYVKAAILHSKPYEQAVSMMFEDTVRDIPNFYTEIFTTKEAATKWLLFYDVDYNEKRLLKKERKFTI